MKGDDMNRSTDRWRELAITLTWDPERQHTLIEANFAIWHKGEPFVTNVQAQSVGVLLGVGGLMYETDILLQKFWDRIAD